MQIKDESHRPTTFWCWITLVVAALFMFSAVAFLLCHRYVPLVLERSSPQAYAFPQVPLQLGPAVAAEPLTTAQLITKTIPVGDMLSALEQQLGQSEGPLRMLLPFMIRCSAPGQWLNHPGQAHLPENVAAVASDRRAANETDDLSKPSIIWSGDDLIIRHTQHGHDQIARHLETLRVHGYAQLCVGAQFLSGPAAVLNAPGIKWRLIGGTPPQAASDDSLSREEAGVAQLTTSVQSITEKQLPALVALISPLQAGQLLAAAQSNPSTNLFQSPKVTVFNGQLAHIEIGNECPFVVGIKPVDGPAFEPQIRVITEGTSLLVRSELHPDNRVHLDLGLTLSSVSKVETAELPLGPGREPIAVQVPEVTSTRVSCAVDMDLNHTLAIYIPAPKSHKTRQPFCILIHVQNVTPEAVAE